MPSGRKYPASPAEGEFSGAVADSGSDARWSAAVVRYPLSSKEAVIKKAVIKEAAIKEAAMTVSGRGQTLVSWVARGAGYFALWVVLIGFDSADFLVGLVAAAAATWASVYLLPPGEFRLRFVGLPRYGLRFLWQSVVAGVDVARQAFAPRQSLRPGLLSYAPHYPPGARRDAFASLTSLLPGTLVLCDEPERLTYHCLDDRQPLVEQLAAEEDALSRALPRDCV